MRYQLLTDELAEQIKQSSPEAQADWILVSESDDFAGFWDVNGLDDEFFYDFEELLGRYQILSPMRVGDFLSKAVELQYKVAFLEDPEAILAEYEALRKDPPVSLSSTLEHTTRGMLPWQVIGFNKLIQSDIPAGLAIWITGSGKTALIAASIKWRLEREEVDLAMVVVKTHNKIEMQRKLLHLAGIESIVIDGAVEKRDRLYGEIQDRLEDGIPTVVILNYEKIRDDEGLFDGFVTGRRCLFYWDEMPTKLSSRTTQLYGAVRRLLYKSFTSQPRPKWMRHLVLTATPIENDPDGLFSYLHLVRPYLLGTVEEFHAAHVTSRNWISGKPDGWEDLDKIEAKVEHMTHRVSKVDPDVAKMFPDVMRQPKIIDWNPKHRAVYDRFTNAAQDLLKEEGKGVNVLSMIQVLQMLCDAPSMVKMSAANREAFSALVARSEEWGGEASDWSGPTGSEAAVQLLSMVDSSKLTDVGHAKLDAVREIVLEKHPDEKVVMHSTWASYIFPVWHHWLDKWGVSYVTYAGSDKERQRALDAFRDDPSIRMLLSGDAGSDSVDMDVASVGINYNGPWKASTEGQREGRRDRVTSQHEIIYTYTLMMADSVEDRKREIRDQKQGYHDAIFEGRAVEGALSAKLTRADLFYMLTGDLIDSCS